MKLLYLLVPFLVFGIVSSYTLPGHVVKGNIDLYGNKVLNSTDPVNNTDLATKYYVDSTTTDLTALPSHTVSGDIDMLGNCIINGSLPVNTTDFVTKEYVDIRTGVVVGPSSDGIQYDYITDGTADESQISAALATGSTVYLMGSSYPYNLSSGVSLPAGRSRIIGVLVGGNRPNLTALFSSGSVISASSAVNTEITGLDLYLNGRNINGISLIAGSTDSVISYNDVHGQVQSSSSARYPILIMSGSAFVNTGNSVIGNYVHDNVGAHQICVFEDRFSASSVISRNRVYHGKPFFNQSYNGIHGAHTTISFNSVIGYGNKSSVYWYSYGGGISGGTAAVIIGNYVEGVGNSGIIPGQDNVVSSNTIVSPGVSGIDFWYSSYSSVTGNRIKLAGMMRESDTSWDQCGIDASDHSSYCSIVGNNIEAGVLVDTLSSQADLGDFHISVNSLSSWPEGCVIKIGTTDEYRIDYIDHVNGLIYLTTALTDTYSSSTAVVAVSGMNLGVNVGDNSQGGGDHNVMANYIRGASVDKYVAPGASILENTYVDDYLYTSTPTYIQRWNAPVCILTGGKYYLAFYVYGAGTKKVECT